LVFDLPLAQQKKLTPLQYHGILIKGYCPHKT